MAHALTAHLGPRDLDAAALADDALVADALVLAAVALPVLGRTEDALAEEAVLLGLQRAVVDRLRLRDLAEHHDRICFEDARPISIASKLLMSIKAFLSPRRRSVGDRRRPRCRPRARSRRRGVASASSSAGVVLGARLAGPRSRRPRSARRPRRRAVAGAHAGEVDAELLGRAQEVVVLVAHLGARALLGDDVDVERQRLHLLQQDLEGLGDRRLGDVLALDDRLVGLHAPDGVVGLDGEHLLQRVRRAVGLQRPDLHLAEALAAELRLAAQRLLGDERVGAGRASVDLVVHEVQELQDVHVADGDLLLERLAGAAVEERELARGALGPRGGACRSPCGCARCGRPAS